MGLSVAAILLAVVLVAGLLAWVRRDLRARGVSMRVWWLVLACYAFAAVAWLIAISVPLPVVLAWLATIPAAVATVIPERLAGRLGGSADGRRPIRRSLQPASSRPPGASDGSPERRLAIDGPPGAPSAHHVDRRAPSSTTGADAGAAAAAIGTDGRVDHRRAGIGSARRASGRSPIPRPRLDRRARSARRGPVAIAGIPASSAWPWRCWRTPLASPTWTKLRALGSTPGSLDSTASRRRHRPTCWRSSATTSTPAWPWMCQASSPTQTAPIGSRGSSTSWIRLLTPRRPADAPTARERRRRSDLSRSVRTASAGQQGRHRRRPALKPPGHGAVRATSRWPVVSREISTMMTMRGSRIVSRVLPIDSPSR